MNNVPENAQEPSREYLFKSPPMKIGKTLWRFVVYRGSSVFTDYEFYSDTSQSYRQSKSENKNLVFVQGNTWNIGRNHKNYDFNDTYYGLPRSLFKLWKIHGHQFAANGGV